MRDPARRRIVDAGRGDLRDVVERDAARGFEREPARRPSPPPCASSAASMLSSSTASRDPDVEHLAQLIERIDLDLDLDQMAGDGLGALEHRADAAGDRDVVVLDQDRVIEAEAVIEAAAAAHGVFLERAQPRRGLARAADARAVAGGAADEFMRRGRDAGQMAEKVERHALGGEHRARRAGDRHQRGLGRDGGAVARLAPRSRCRARACGRSPRPAAGRRSRRPCARPRWRAPACLPGWSRSR